MNGSMIQLDAGTENKIRNIFPVTLTDNDLEWASDWFLMVGIATVCAAMIEHPELTLGDLVNLSFKFRDSH